MKIRILSLAVAMTMLTACDDDGGYSQQVDDATMCVGSFASANRGQLEAGSTSSGACANDQSLDVACTVNLQVTAGGCGKPCVIDNFGDNDAIKACNTTCMQEALVDDPTKACLDCYSDTVVCSAVNCQSQCLADASSPACLQCQAMNCLPAFFACTGYPAPQSGDAGP